MARRQQGGVLDIRRYLPPVANTEMILVSLIAVIVISREGIFPVSIPDR